MLTRYFDRMRLVFEGQGGTIEKIIGDAIVAVFGLPDAAADDHVRALEAAWQSVAALVELNDSLEVEWGVRLTTRTGVATGEVIVGEAGGGQHVLTGEAMVVAVTMEQNCQPMGVLVADSTFRLVEDFVTAETAGPFSPKGLDAPILAHQLVSVSPASERAIAPAATARTLDVRAASPVAHETRRTVTLVFADPKPTTLTGEPPDPEALKDVMSLYFDEMRRLLERHGATIEKFIGDAVMAVFGIPVRHEDDALRAVRAALDMQAALPPLNADFVSRYGIELLNHIGVNTGEVVAGDASVGQRLVSGDAVNVAARLEQAAAAREVLVGPLTYRLVRDAVEVEPVEPLTLKGKSEPFAAYRLIAVQSIDATARRQDAPMVGREAEMRELLNAYRATSEARAARLITVVGDAGVGKTRLTREFLRRIGPLPTVVKGRCLPYGDGITYWPMIEIVRGAARIRENDPPDSARLRIAATVGAENAAVAERIASLIGLDATPYPVAELSWAIRRFFELLARDDPLVAVIDDIHWAEETFLDLLDSLASSIVDAPVLLLCTARNELLEERAEWGVSDRGSRIVLSPLSDGEAEQVVGNLLGRVGIADTVAKRIAAAAEGNPLFVEQLLSMLTEGGVLREDGGRWIPTRDLSDIAIPPTIAALAASRLDALPGEERGVLEPASVIGLNFARDAVLELVEPAIAGDLPAHLDDLARRQLIRQTQPDPESLGYRFSHLVIRDAAYQGLLKRSRALLHERFVAWADRVNAAQDRALEFEEILGYHLEQAYLYRTQLGPLDAHGVELGVRASERLGPAGERAFARGDLPAAANLIGRAAAVLPRESPSRPWLLLLLGQVRMERGEFESSASAYDEAADAASLVGNEGLLISARIEILRLRYLTGSGEPDARVIEEVRSFVPALEALSFDEGLARAWRLLGTIDVNAMRWGSAECAMARTMEFATRAGNRLVQTRALPNIATFAVYSPTPVGEGIATCEDVLMRVGTDRRGRALTLRSLARLQSMRGDFEISRRRYAEARAVLEELGWQHDAAMTSIYSGPSEMLAGDLEAAERELRRDYDVYDRMGERYFISTTAAYLGEALFRQGRLDEAGSFIAFSQEVAAEDDVMTEVLWRGTRAKLMARTGECPAAVEVAREAVRLASESDDPTIRADIDMTLGEVLEVAGDLDGAAGATHDAVDLYRAKGNVVAARQAEARLAALEGATTAIRTAIDMLGTPAPATKVDPRL